MEWRSVDIYLDVWFIYWRRSFLFRLPRPQLMFICTNILHGSGVLFIYFFFFFVMVNIWDGLRSKWKKFNAENELRCFNDLFDIYTLFDSDAFLHISTLRHLTQFNIYLCKVNSRFVIHVDTTQCMRTYISNCRVSALSERNLNRLPSEVGHTA